MSWKDGFKKRGAEPVVAAPPALLDRRAFFAAVGERLQHADSELLDTLLIANIDEFASVNRSIGHLLGDDVLDLIADRLLSIAARPNVIVGRLGGDAFGVFCSNISHDRSTAIAYEVVDLVGQTIRVGTIDLQLDVSIGLAACPANGTTVRDLLGCADLAMQEAKAAKVVVKWGGKPHETDTSANRLVLLGDLRRAISEQELQVHYQPKLKLANRAMHGVEALVRWPHPTYGFVSPAEFVTAAEQTGVIQELTHFVLDTSLTQCKQWFDAGLELRVAVNVSTRNLLHHKFAERVAALLRHHKIRGEYLVLEITEGSLMQEPAKGREALERIKSLGVEIALDDFGTGFSSLGYLNKLPIDELKIDRSFLFGVADSPSQLAVLRGAITLGRDLGLRTVVEGVEHEHEADLLHRLNAEIGQGYLFSRPVPGSEIAAMMAPRMRFVGARP